MSKYTDIVAKFLKDHNLKFTIENLKSMEGTYLEYELKMLLVKAGLLKTIQRKTIGNVFSL